MIYAIDRIVADRQLVTSSQTMREVMMHAFVSAYEELRRRAPKGDLRIHLSVDDGVPVCNPAESIYCCRVNCDTCRGKF